MDKADGVKRAISETLIDTMTLQAGFHRLLGSNPTPGTPKPFVPRVQWVG